MAQYDFLRDATGLRLGGRAEAIWTRASQFMQTPGHGHDLGVELDGGHHALQVEADEARSRYLAAQGWRVLRFWNNEVLENVEGVVEVILTAVSR